MDGDEARVKASPIGNVGTTTLIEVKIRNRYFTPPPNMGMTYGFCPTGLEEGLVDDMHFTMVILFSKMFLP